ncbi:hypothetical protein [Nicoliella lavandulae]|uniref:Uncharacterized protein n=1 Tax=Nicoliella lavandulae TaxID=3082954 RepID=A0ABU8SLU8_9LACO
MSNSLKRTSDSLINYNKQLKAGLANGIKFTDLMDVMIETSDKNKLLDAVHKLVKFRLSTEFVNFPIQYSKADFYLLFMNRLLEEHNLSTATQLKTGQIGNSLVQYLDPLSNHDSFRFSINNSQVAYIDTQMNEPIFYLDFDAKLLAFNNESLLEVFVYNLKDQLGAKAVSAAINILMKFASFMAEDYGYQVNYSILDTRNALFTSFATHDFDRHIIDQLFVSAAENGYSLMAYNVTGAQLELDDVQVNIFDSNQGEAKSAADWGLQVVDPKNKVSWFQLLLKYDFLKNWYLDNLEHLELETRAQKIER